MGSPYLCRDNAILPFTPATDFTDKEGYLVTLSGDTATLSASASVHAKGIVLAGSTTSGSSTIGILGSLAGTCNLKISGTVTKGDLIQQSTDGTGVTDAGSGARVVFATALASGTSGALIEVATFKPISLS